MSNTNSESSVNMSSKSTETNSIFDNFAGSFSNKNTIIIFLLVLLLLSFIGINLLALSGKLVADITTPLAPAFKSLLSMIGFTLGNLINGSADLVANTADVGIDIAKGTTHSIGDLLIQTTNYGEVDFSKQLSLSDVIGVQKLRSAVANTPQPAQSTTPIVTPISTQKAKAGWCYVGDFSGARGCVQVTEHDKCMSGQIFASQSECLKPSK